MAEEIRLRIGCGWCITGVHTKCLPQITHPEVGKVWLCGCKTCHPAAEVTVAVKAEADPLTDTEDTE